MLDQPSPVITTKTVVKEFKRVSKLLLGEVPFARSTEPSSANLDRKAKSSIPNRAKVNMKRPRRMEKMLTSSIVLLIVLKSTFNLFHDLASLKILMILKALKVVITPMLEEFRI